MKQASKKRLFLDGHFSSMKDQYAKRRYLCVIGGLDPYETERKEWKDGIDLWPSKTHIQQWS